METLAACGRDEMSILHGKHGFSQRLAGHLNAFAQTQSGVTVDELNTVLLQDGRSLLDVIHVDGMSYKGSRQNARILNCGQGSILLKPLAGGVEGVRLAGRV
jgi:hypothetical protein